MKTIKIIRTDQKYLEGPNQNELLILGGDTKIISSFTHLFAYMSYLPMFENSISISGDHQKLLSSNMKYRLILPNFSSAERLKLTHHIVLSLTLSCICSMAKHM